MAKTIWHIRADRYLKEPVLDKYVVVYENDEWYYCKVSGSKVLVVMNRERLDNGDVGWYVSRKKGEKEDEIHAALLEAKKEHRRKEATSVLNKKIRELEERKANIKFLEDEVAKMMAKLDNVGGGVN